MANDALHMLLHSNMETQIHLMTITTTDDDFEGPATEANMRARRIREFGGILNNLRNSPADQMMTNTITAAANYGAVIEAAQHARDASAEVDYRAYQGILNAIVTQAT